MVNHLSSDIEFMKILQRESSLVKDGIGGNVAICCIDTHVTAPLSGFDKRTNWGDI